MDKNRSGRVKRGVTLIELLAVIVILTVIALIAMPVILSLVDKSRRKIAEESAKYGWNVTDDNSYQIVSSTSNLQKLLGYWICFARGGISPKVSLITNGRQLWFNDIQINRNYGIQSVIAISKKFVS